MPEAFYSVVLDHPAGDVWRAIRRFDHYAWAGVPGETRIENGMAGDQVGAVRCIRTNDGVVRRQILLAHSDFDRSYTYGLCDPPYLPLQNYVATIHVIPVAEDDMAFVEWSARFDCDTAESRRWIDYFQIEGFPAWLRALRRFMAEDRSRREAVVAPGRLMQMSGGFGPPLVVETALRLRVFDLLAEENQTTEELCARTTASIRSLRILLNALVGLDLLTKAEDGRYALTAESSLYLVSGKPSFHGAFFLLASEAALPNWSRLTDIVKSGQPPRRINREEDGVTYFLRFVENLFPIHLPGAMQLATALDIAKTAAPISVLDLAAGSGVWSIAFAKQSPQVRVTAVDWPAVVEVTRRVAEREGVAERFHYVAGDLLEADYGNGHAFALAGHILHSEGETRSRLLLRKIFNALAPGGTIAIAEILVDADRRGPLPALLFAVNMLVNTEQGDTFSFEEIRFWLHEAGFEAVRTVAVAGLARRIVLAMKPRADAETLAPM